MFDLNNFHILQGPYGGEGGTSPSTPSKFKQGLGAVAKSDPGAFGQIAEGLVGIAGGIVGGRARRQEQRAARLDLEKQRREYEQFEFQNPYANVTNPFEDLKVGTQAADFAAQQQQQALAGTLGSLKATAGGSGVAALAQALSQQQSQNLQASAANIEQQETRNQIARAQGQQRMEQLQGAGAEYLQEKQFGRIEDMYETAATRKMAADEARKQATEGLIGGIANVGVGVGRIAAGGV